jgi:thiol:disulfide interchange protein
MRLQTFLLFLFFSLVSVTSGFAQTSQKITIYKPEANAAADLQAAVTKAKAENKHVLLQIGGNWCSWCLKFHNLTTSDAQLDSALRANYVVLKINYSKENQNLPVLKQLEYPQRFGFPVFVVLNSEGKRLHTQNSAYLEEDKGYSKKKIMEFLDQWSKPALTPERYEKKQ